MLCTAAAMGFVASNEVVDSQLVGVLIAREVRIRLP